jgi:uncharacterized protein (TIGR00290 family)
MSGDRPKAVVSWSSGKDAAYSLWKVREEGAYDVVGLLTTVTGTFSRVSMHGVREVLLDQQAAAAGLPVTKVTIPFPCPNEVYERAMGAAVDGLHREGVTHVIFGDLYLEDVRAYRERRLENTGITPVFPLWGRPTSALAEEMVESGLVAHVVCLDPRKLPAEFGGRRFDRSFLQDLPRGVDPCGENGEFHTFASGGPMFSRPVPVRVGDTVERDGFVFTDLTPG